LRVGGRPVDGVDVPATEDLLRFGGIMNWGCDGLF
jgi:hypothetical protein